MSIVIIEDNIIHSKLISRAIKLGGRSEDLIYLQDGEKAVRYFENEPSDFPRLVLLDINLPKVNGIEVLKKIKGDKRYQTLPVVILTTSDSRTDMDMCAYFKANDYIVKSTDMEEFMKKVVRIINYWLDNNR
ncbi:MAG: response regulator [bacterium]